MTVSFVAVLPAIMPDLASQCITSMVPELRERLLLVDNTATSEIAEEHCDKVLFACAEGRNAGVPHAWNDGITMARTHDADYLLIVSQSIQFGAAGGQDFLDVLDLRRPSVMLDAQFGWKLIAVSLDAFGRVGLFDTIFTPAYYEESDWMYRAHLAGLASPWYNARPGREQVVTIDAQSAGDGVAFRTGVVPLDYGAQRARFVAKWGGVPREERWTHPYDDVLLDWTYTGEPRKDER